MKKMQCRCFLAVAGTIRCVTQTTHHRGVCNTCRKPEGCASLGRKLVPLKKARQLVNV